MIPLLLTKLLVRSGAARYLPAARRRAQGGEDFLHYYSDRVLAAPVAEMTDPATFPAAPTADVIDLNVGAPQFASPLSLGRPTADRGTRPEAWGLPALRQAVARTQAHLTGLADGDWPDPAREVLITQGASGGYAAVLDALVNPGDRVVVFDPTAPLLALGAASRRAAVRRVPTTVTAAGDLHYDPDALSRAMRGAKLVVLADPGNPTGASLTPAQRDHLIWAAKRSDVLIVLDETFTPFRYEGHAAPMPAAQDRTLRIGSVTPYGLASARVGWVTGPHHLLKAVALTATLNAPFVPALCQHLAARELARAEDLFGPTVEELRARRRYALDRLTGMGLPAPTPRGGYFAWVDVSRAQPAKPGTTPGRAFAERLLREAGVLVGPGCAFGPAGANFVRVSFAAEDGRLREGLSRLARFVNGPTASKVVAPVKEEREAAFSRA